MVKRAAILIGVNRAGSLPELQDAVPGAQRMAKWALDQGMQPELVKLITDEEHPVGLDDIKKAVNDVLASSTVEQLIVYFGGHGMNIGYCEYWLLSDALTDSQAAVNLEGSVVLARRASAAHIVFISDACRTAADSLAAHSMMGGQIFPISPPAGLDGQERPVDLFFASTLGQPAFEIKDPAVASSAYKAIYTVCLNEALSGTAPHLVEPETLGDKAFGVIRPRPLKAYLSKEVARRLRESGAAVSVVQTPDARITSDDTAWLAQLPLVATPPGPPAPPGEIEVSSPRILRAEILGESWSGEVELSRDSAGIRESLRRAQEPFPPYQLDTACGFKVRGAQITDAYSVSGVLKYSDGGDRHVLRVAGPVPASNVLLVFDNGTAALLPAIPQFITGLTFQDKRLTEVVYEPSIGTERWMGTQSLSQPRHRLRAVMGATSEWGATRLGRTEAVQLARQLQYHFGTDPALSLLSAYAYYDLQLGGLVRDLHTHVQEDLRMQLFDVALLADAVDGKRSATPGVYPFVPLLSRGWAMLAARRVTLPARLTSLPQHLLPSLWTLFDHTGAALIADALRRQEVS